MCVCACVCVLGRRRAKKRRLARPIDFPRFPTPPAVLIPSRPKLILVALTCFPPRVTIANRLFYYCGRHSFLTCFLLLSSLNIHSRPRTKQTVHPSRSNRRPSLPTRTDEHKSQRPLRSSAQIDSSQSKKPGPPDYPRKSVSSPISTSISNVDPSIRTICVTLDNPSPGVVCADGNTSHQTLEFLPVAAVNISASHRHLRSARGEVNIPRGTFAQNSSHHIISPKNLQVSEPLILLLS
ncbi:hypothetical protein LZ30DRAFT_429561 [Colletotrichum cereale]|nr:hypothetical protein LZ30DRAFT_429561 [Colletotrichum cereale]